MKLSESGIQKIWQWSCNDIKGDLKDLEFTQEDFAKSIVMSIDEAKALCYILKWIQNFGYVRETKKHFDCEVEKLRQRIKKTEKK